MKKSSVHLGLINPKTPSNVGSIMRAAGCYQVDAVFYTGERYDRGARFCTDTRNMRQSIPLVRVASLLDDIPEGMNLV